MLATTTYRISLLILEITLVTNNGFSGTRCNRLA